MKNYRTLVLNANYRPLAIIGWSRAIVLVFEGRMIELDFYKGEKIKDGHGRYYTIPAVVARKTFIKRRVKQVPFCKKNVYMRDACTCQYCGDQFEPKDLTYDHVIPRSKWKSESSPTCWENIVTCCIPCNHKKGDQTCEAARMHPISPPARPKYGEAFLGISPWRDQIPNEWLPYLSHIPSFSRMFRQNGETYEAQGQIQ